MLITSRRPNDCVAVALSNHFQISYPYIDRWFTARSAAWNQQDGVELPLVWDFLTEHIGSVPIHDRLGGPSGILVVKGREWHVVSMFDHHVVECGTLIPVRHFLRHWRLVYHVAVPADDYAPVVRFHDTRIVAA